MALTGLLKQSVILETFNSVDRFGDVTYNAAVTLPARVERRVKVVRSMKGETAVSTAAIFLNGTVALDPYGRDRITINSSALPLTFPFVLGGMKPVILAIEDGVDGAGKILYVEVDV
jgi:hypothetical protein